MLKSNISPIIFFLLPTLLISCSTSKTPVSSTKELPQSVQNDTVHQQIDTSTYKQSIQHAVEEKLLPKYKKK